MDSTWLVFPLVVPFGDPAYDSGLGGAHDLDVKPPPNYPVRAVKSGVVSDVSSPPWGKQVGVLLDTPINGVPNMAYLHLSAVRADLKVGMRVAAGDLLGWVGGATTTAQYLGTTNPTGANFLNTPDMSSQAQVGLALMRGDAYGGAGWEKFPPVDWALDPTPTLDQARKEFWLQSNPVINRLGRVGLFFGIETFSWNTAQWTSGADFCKVHHINFAIIKVFEIGSGGGVGEWYGGNTDPIVKIFTDRGVQVLFYGFLYGGSGLPWEIGMLEKYMSKYGAVCADMEGGWWSGNAADAQKIHDALTGKSGFFLASIPADPDIATFKPLASRINMAMPMAYDDLLTSVYPNNMAAIGSMSVGPTFDLSNEFGANNLVFNVSHSNGQPQISFWEYGFATANPGLLDQLVSIAGSLPAGGTMIPTGWHDVVVNGDWRLTNPQNSFIVRGAFRGTVLNWPSGWPTWNIPKADEEAVPQLEMSNAPLGPGIRQRFANTTLEMVTNQNNKIISGWIGQELDWYMKALAADDIALATANSKVSELQTLLDACIAQGGTLTPAQQKAVNDGIAALEELKVAFTI
jgi:hypothetical protein